MLEVWLFAGIGTVALAVVALFATWKLRYRYPSREVPQVLCYHKLSDRFCWEGTWTSVPRFIGHIDSLLDDGYRFIDEDEFLESLGKPAPDNAKRLLLTFDDGYQELHDLFFAHLAPRKIPLLVFLITDYVGKENRWDLSLGRRPFRHLAWPQIREMSDRGVAFGSHGATHRDLTHLPQKDLVKEIGASKRAIEKETGVLVRCFSYPFGRYNGAARSVVHGAEYDAAFSLYPQHGNEHIDRLALRRNGVYVIDTPRTIRRKLEPDALFWLEEMKCRTINGVALLTPALKRWSADPGR